MSGRFISFEGGEGAGKTTQARLLSAALAGRGMDCIVTREPGGTPGAETIRSLLLDGVGEGEGEGWGVGAEALLFAAARADHVERLIRPALAAGTWVICDRFIDSSRAYQGGGGGLSDADILSLHRVGSGGLLPDLTLLVEVPPDEVAARLAARDNGVSDRIGGRELAFHRRVAEAFRRFAEAEPQRFARIDGDGTPEAIHQRVMQAVDRL